MPESPAANTRGLKPQEVVAAWLRILAGTAPMLSLEITKECPLSCPGCYAYNPGHLGGDVSLRDLSEFRGQALVDGVIGLVKKHRPVHVSLVGGEPMMRRRELEQILPRLSDMNIFTLLVTSAVIPIPSQWMNIPRLRVTISVDGLPEHHDVRRKPATYERILRNIKDCRVNVHLTITRAMLQSPDYLDEYFSFWSARPELDRFWVSTYSPQVGEDSAEILTPQEREDLFRYLRGCRKRFPKALLTDGIVDSFIKPPADPSECVFSKMSVNYSSDFSTRVEPCILGGTPDCSQCGCAASVGLHALEGVPLLGPLKVGHLVNGSIAIGAAVNRIRRSMMPERWNKTRTKTVSPDLVQIEPGV